MFVCMKLMQQYQLWNNWGHLSFIIQQVITITEFTLGALATIIRIVNWQKILLAYSIQVFSWKLSTKYVYLIHNIFIFALYLSELSHMHELVLNFMIGIFFFQRCICYKNWHFYTYVLNLLLRHSCTIQVLSGFSL